MEANSWHSTCSPFFKFSALRTKSSSIRVCYPKLSPCGVRVVSQHHEQPNKRHTSLKALDCRSKEASEYADVDVDPPKTGLRKKKLAIFVSGGGSNFRAVHEAIRQGVVLGEVTVLVTDKAGCGGALYARNNAIPVILFPKSSSLPEGFSSSDLVAALRRYEIDFIMLAGYLKLIPKELVQAYPRCIVNIHPSLLPAFGGKGYYGLKVHKAVIASGARYSGPTIHFVDENYDTGRILAQRVVQVMANDSAEELAARVLREEHELYVEVAAAMCEDRIKWRVDGVPVIQSVENPNEYK